MSGIKGKIALVTGGGRGIGRATAIEFSRRGCKVVSVSRTKKELEETRKLVVSEGGECIAVSGDVRRPSDVKRVVKTAVKTFGGIDFLVNNAGVAVFKPFEEHTEKDYGVIMDTNLKGIFLFIKYALPVMLKQETGVIVNVSSGAGKHGIGWLSVYCASKFGVIGLTESLAEEFPKSIKVYAVCPGGTNTKMYLDMWPDTDPKSLLQPEDVAKKIVSLCLPGCRIPSGSAVDVRKSLF